MGFSALSPELVEHVLLSTLDGPTRFVQVDTLACLGQVNTTCAGAAQRLLYKNIVLDSSRAANKLLDTLRQSPHLALVVKSLTFKPIVFNPAATLGQYQHQQQQAGTSFTIVQQDELIRLCSNLVHLDSPESSLAPFAEPEAGDDSSLFPKSLRSLRYIPPDRTNEPAYQPDDSDDEDQDGDNSQAMNSSTVVLPRAVSDFECLPHNLTRLRLSNIKHRGLIFEPPSEGDFPFPHLETLILDCLHMSPAAFEWLVAGSKQLAALQVWLVTGITEECLKDALEYQNDRLREFTFKDNAGLRQYLSHDLVSEMVNLEKLTLGNGACDHTIYVKLPASLTHICISLPNHHVNARLDPVADELTKRLTRVVRLELYSHFYYPPPVEIEYAISPAAQQQNKSQLRELRLSHLNAGTGQITKFLSHVGTNLTTLAVHRVSESYQNMLPLCPRLKRLELGGPKFVDPATPILSTLHGASLNFFRVTVSQTDTNLEALQQAIPKLPQLRTLDLIAAFPLAVTDTAWLSGALFDDLLDTCKARGVLLCVNGRTIRTPGTLWKAITAGHAGRDTL